MRIAILTQPLGGNYGGIMQAYALQQVLKRMGHSPVTIDRRADDRALSYKVARFLYRTVRSKISPRHRLAELIRRNTNYVQQHTADFIARNVEMSEPIRSTEDLRNHFIAEQYDAVVVGSDQVWRPKYSPNLPNYFLDFSEGMNFRAVAYAASFGTSEWEYSEVQQRQCQTLLKRFDGVSVRESSAVQLVRQKLGVEAVHVLDPTLLLTSQDYRALLPQNRAQRSNTGLYTYILDSTPAINGIIAHVAESLVERPYNVQPRPNRYDYSGGLEDYVMPTVEEWLAGFADARFVLTDSFHGTAFSIIFGKPFKVIDNSTRGSARVYSLIESLGGSASDFILEAGQILDGHHQLNFKCLSIIDSDDRLSRWRKSSEDFLYGSLS